MEKRYWYITPEDYEEAKKNGISKTLLDQRVRRYGWDIDRAVKTKNRRNLLPDEVLKEAAKNGICRENVFSRLRCGWSLEKAISTPPTNSNKRLYPDWVYETADKNGITYSTVYNRIHRGWSMKKACTKKAEDNGRRRH